MDNGSIRGGVVYERRRGQWTLGESGVEECTWSMRGGREKCIIYVSWKE